MFKKIDKNANRVARHKRVRKKVTGTAERPRLCVFRSSKNIYAQIIDDANRVTLVSASSLDEAIKGAVSYTGNKEAARKVGELVAKKAAEKGITEVVFDRGGYIYHGRVAALVVVGDSNGHVGIGSGKAMEVPDAIKKAVEDAKKNLIVVPRVGTTVPHEVVGHFGAGNILIMPAKEGTGVLAGGPVRAVLELAGVMDVRAKSTGSNNPRNMVNATIAGLKSLKTAESIARLRGKKVEELLG